MEPFSHYRQYSLAGIKRNGRKPSKRDLPEQFVDLMERMGFEIEDSPDWMKNCLGICRGPGLQYVARVDFNEGIVIAEAEEQLDRIKTLGLDELTLRNVCFHIPDTYGGGSMRCQSDIDKRIPKFRDYLNRFSFELVIDSNPLVRKRFAKKESGILWGGCIEVFPNEPWGAELYRLCLKYR